LLLGDMGGSKRSQRGLPNELFRHGLRRIFVSIFVLIVVDKDPDEDRDKD
jgi:hypothetical protein